MTSSPTPASQRRAWMGQLLMLFPGAILLAIPWMFSSGLTVVLGWIGLTLILMGRSNARGWLGCIQVFLACTLAITIAFHWAPGAMAYAVNASQLVGLSVAIVLYLLDGARLAIPIWFGGYLAKSPYSLWYTSGALAVIVETAVSSVFPWRLGYFQLHVPLIVQSVDLFGPGMSTLMAYAFAGCMLLLVRSFLSRSNNAGDTADRVSTVERLAPAALCIVALIYGVIQLHFVSYHDATRTLRVAVAQVYPSSTESIGVAQRLSNDISESVDLVCWPESIGGTYSDALADLSDFQQVFENSAEPDRGLRPWPQAKYPLLFGGKCFRGTPDDQQQVQVSAFLLGQNAEILGRYDKRYLMPFGEYVPLKDWLPFMEDLFGHWDTITPGQEPTTLQIGDAKIGAMLCYEDMVPSAARSLVRAEANVLFSLADGSSFENPLTLQQHRLLAQARAIENRRYMVRCASTGETCVISPVGIIEQRIPLQQDAIMIADVPLSDATTLYSRIGELPLLVFLAASLMFGWISRLFRHPGKGAKNPLHAQLPLDA